MTDTHQQTYLNASKLYNPPIYSMEEKDTVKNGLVGKFLGWRRNGKTYDVNGKEIKDKHEQDCFCCRKSLLAAPTLISV